MSYLDYLSIFQTPPPKPLTWKENIEQQITKYYESALDYIGLIGNYLLNLIIYQIPNTLDYYYTEVYHDLASNSTSVALSIFFACLLIFFVTIWFHSKDEVKITEETEKQVKKSEKRWRSKEKHHERPTKLEKCAPELLPGLRAERCVKDGLAILDIKEDEKKKKSEENITKHTSLKLGTQKGISLDECLTAENGTLEFLNGIITKEFCNDLDAKKLEPSKIERRGTFNNEVHKTLIPRPKKTNLISENNHIFKINSNDEVIRQSSASAAEEQIKHETCNIRPKSRHVLKHNYNEGDRKVSPMSNFQLGKYQQE